MENRPTSSARSRDGLRVGDMSPQLQDFLRLKYLGLCGTQRESDHVVLSPTAACVCVYGNALLAGGVGEPLRGGGGGGEKKGLEVRGEETEPSLHAVSPLVLLICGCQGEALGEWEICGHLVELRVPQTA